MQQGTKCVPTIELHKSVYRGLFSEYEIIYA